MPPKALDSAALFRDIRCESPCVSAQEWLWFERRAWRPQEQETPAASFDHLVGAGEKRWRDGEVERFGGFEIDNKLKSAWAAETGGHPDAHHRGCVRHNSHAAVPTHAS